MVTLADLVEAADGSRWLVEDWSALGLIDAGYSPGRGRGPGRAERVWPDEQLELMRELRSLRAEGWPVRGLCDVVIGRWLRTESAITPRQASRALRTWSWPQRRRSRRVAGSLARELLIKAPDAERRAWLGEVVNALHHGRSLRLPLPQVVENAATVPREEAARPWERYFRMEAAFTRKPRSALVKGARVDDLRLRAMTKQGEMYARGANGYAREHIRRNPDRLQDPGGPRGSFLDVPLAHAVAGITALDDASTKELERVRGRFTPTTHRRSADSLRGGSLIFVVELARSRTASL